MKANKQYKLYPPTSNWDENYYVLDKKNNIEYLIDINDVYDDSDDLTDDEKDCYLHIKDLTSLIDIEHILSFSWKNREVEHQNFEYVFSKIQSDLFG